MPGELIEGHAEYENECELCHNKLRDVPESELCLDCHKEVNLDVQNQLGFHGRIIDLKKTNIKSLECKECHGDHLGRQGNILGIDKDNFEHVKTDFELLGKHSDVSCASCHVEDKTYREAPSQCIDCHESSDPHRGEFGRECQDCHSPKDWLDTQFDHDETKFPLKGSHQIVECNSCHADEQYTDIPEDCFSCHALNDVHGGTNGSKCNSCHNESDWKKLTFDHDTDTRFKLKNGHNNLTCNSCHKTSGFEKKIGRACISCHKSDDEHSRRNGKQCSSCHTTTRWSTLTFDHNRNTDFDLDGKHSTLTCESCHQTGTQNVKLETSCIACHESDDVHKGQEGRQCDSCHNSTGWREQVQFNHDLTSFPLLGMHAVANCESCHESKAFQQTNTQCVDCHQDDDAHEQGLGSQCVDCHNPNSWRLWVFDHNQQTDFQLDGSHTDLSCTSCHKKPIKSQTNSKIKISTACSSCHLNDDVHNKKFGRACERCHVTESFNSIRMQ